MMVIRPLQSWLSKQCLLHIMKVLVYDFFYVLWSSLVA